MGKLLGCVLVALVFSVAASAAAIDTPCATTQTIAALVRSGGCWEQDKLFTNFTYEDGGAMGAANVGALSTFDNVGTVDIHGFTFKPFGATTIWTSSFSLGYTITVFTGPMSLVGATDQLMFSAVPNATTAVSTKTSGVVIALFDQLSYTTQTQHAMFDPVLTLDSNTVVTIPGGSFLSTLEENYTQAVVPEPATLALIGAGLIGLGMLRRKRFPRK